MAKWLSGLVAAVVLGGTPLTAWGAGADGEARYSGTVAEVSEQRLVVEEMGPWLGPGTGVKRRAISVAPDTNVVLVKPTGRWDDTATPGWDSQAMKLSDLKRGDFVTVTTRGPQTNAAVSLQVVRPEDR